MATLAIHLSSNEDSDGNFISAFSFLFVSFLTMHAPSFTLQRKSSRGRSRSSELTKASDSLWHSAVDKSSNKPPFYRFFEIFQPCVSQRALLWMKSAIVMSLRLHNQVDKTHDSPQRRCFIVYMLIASHTTSCIKKGRQPLVKSNDSLSHFEVDEHSIRLATFLLLLD